MGPCERMKGKLHDLAFNRQELAGSLGDLGTFIPLLVGMVHQCGLQLGPSLLAAGLMNIATGIAFGIPMPVQPMKAIAAVAIAEGMNESQILIAGIVTGLVITVLGITGLVDALNRRIPRSVVRGLQLAIGLKLLTNGCAMIAKRPDWLAWDGVGLGILCAVVAFYFYSSTRVPGALLIFSIGLISVLTHSPDLIPQTPLGMSWHMPDFASWSDWKSGTLHGALPQIPLTTLNSVIAVCALSADLFPRRSISPRKVAVSVGLMNLLCCPLGAMPMCHGAGGLAAQYRFGARTGGSVVALGVVKCALALLFGSSLLLWLQAYPQSVLGVLLLFSGLELAMVCRDQTVRSAFLIMLLTCGACLAVDTATGFIVGWLLALADGRRIVRLEEREGTSPGGPIGR